MRDFFKIFNAKMEIIFGDAEFSEWKIEKSLLVSNQNPQIISSLLFAFDTKSKYNEWYKNPILLEATSFVLKEVCKNKSLGGFRRWLPIFAESYPLLIKHLPELKETYEPFFFKMASFFAHELKLRQDLTQLTSANVGYGTNHLAVELKGVTQYLNYCSKKIGNIEGIDKKFLRAYLKRFMNYMHPDGYWAECDGPALSYNTLTAVSLMGVADELGELKTYQEKFKTVADFHTAATLPDGRFIDIMDGRNVKCAYHNRGSFLTLTSEGNALYETMITLLAGTMPEQEYFGEPLALLLFDEKMKEKYGVKKSKSLWTKNKLEIKLSDFLIVKNHSWIAGVSNIKFTPRPEGHFNIDYQNLFSLYHTEFGEIFGGQNSKSDPEISTFSKFMTKFDGYPVKTPMPKYTPGNGAIKYQKEYLSIKRDYRGFEGKLEVNFINDKKIELVVSAHARAEEYPIQFNLILPCSTEHLMKDSHQKEITLDERVDELSVIKTGTHLFFDERFGNNVLPKNKKKRLKISVPKEAEIKWPFKPWDTYNLESDRERLPKNWYCLMVVNVNSQPTKITIEIN